MSRAVGPIAVKVQLSCSLLPTLKLFFSALIPRYMKKNMNIEETLQSFYLLYLSHNDFILAFEKLFGELPAGFSSASITRMKYIWQEDHRKWTHSSRCISRSMVTCVSMAFISICGSTKAVCPYCCSWVQTTVEQN
jgi:putative transposase